MNPPEGIGRAIAKRVDRSGLPALFVVLGVRGFGDQRRVLVRYIGHAGANGRLVHDPDAVPTTYPSWMRADRFHLWLADREPANLAETVTIA